MTALIVTISIISLLLGGYLGYRLGVIYLIKENKTLHQQIALLQEQITLLQGFSREWASAAANTYQLSGQIAREQSDTLQTNMNVVIHLLNTIRHDQPPTPTLSSQEQEKLNQ